MTARDIVRIDTTVLRNGAGSLRALAGTTRDGAGMIPTSVGGAPGWAEADLGSALRQTQAELHRIADEWAGIAGLLAERADEADGIDRPTMVATGEPSARDQLIAKLSELGTVFQVAGGIQVITASGAIIFIGDSWLGNPNIAGGATDFTILAADGRLVSGDGTLLLGSTAAGAGQPAITLESLGFPTGPSDSGGITIVDQGIASSGLTIVYNPMSEGQAGPWMREVDDALDRWYDETSQGLIARTNAVLAAQARGEATGGAYPMANIYPTNIGSWSQDIYARQSMANGLWWQPEGTSIYRQTEIRSTGGVNTTYSYGTDSNHVPGATVVGF